MKLPTEEELLRMQDEPNLAEMEVKGNVPSNGKVVKITLDVFGPTWEDAKIILGAKTHQQAFNKMLANVIGWDESELIQKDYGPRRNRRLITEIKKEEQMTRPKVAEADRKKSRSISLTDQEAEMVQASFSSMTRGVLFLMNLMIRLDEEGVIPGHIIIEEMKKV